MIDSHCHLDQEPLINQISDVINRSKKAGVKKILTISTTFDSFNKILDIIKLDPIIYGTFGIHPHEVDRNFTTTKAIVENISKNKKLIGIGETGLDFYYNNSQKVEQINSFKSHIEAAIELNLPVIVHSRNAEKETYEILNLYKKKNPKMLMHWFTGKKKFAESLLNFNILFSASGRITFKNSKELQNTFMQIPNNKLLIETDSPFLAPEPMRGKKNEPSFIKYTANKLAELKNTSLKNLNKILTENFNSLFFK